MSDRAEITGVFQRPTLVDYLIVAEAQELDIGLNIYVGRLEVGLVGLASGRVVYADMPGANGTTALSLLARLTNARIMPNRWAAHLSNVSASWREIVGEPDASQAAGRVQRLAQVRAELREVEIERCEDSGVFDLVERRPSSGDLSARVAAELLDWAVVDAYLHGEFESARGLASTRERLQPGELLSAANLERLRLRVLDDDFVAGVAGARE